MPSVRSARAAAAGRLGRGDRGTAAAAGAVQPPLGRVRHQPAGQTGGRTAPTARNWQEVDLYVARQDGLFLYDATAHALRRVVAQDVRASIGGQEHSRAAPVTLIYVANSARMGMAGEESRAFYSAADTGFIAQNVYLFCASEGLGTVVFASIDRERLAQAIGPEGRPADHARAVGGLPPALKGG